MLREDLAIFKRLKISWSDRKSRQGLGDPAPLGLNPGYADGLDPMDEDEVNLLNNPPVVERTPSPKMRKNRRRRERGVSPRKLTI
jgi:hypothetical protein